MSTYFLAKIFGPYLVIVAIAMLCYPKRYKAVIKEFHQSPTHVAWSGALGLILGLILVNLHNYWIPGWPVVITILCWIVLLKGICRLFFWEQFGGYMKNLGKDPGYKWLSWISLIVGVYVGYMGFFY